MNKVHFPWKYMDQVGRELCERLMHPISTLFLASMSSKLINESMEVR